METGNSCIKQTDWLLRAPPSPPPDSTSRIWQLSKLLPRFQLKRKDLKILTVNILKANGSAAITHSKGQLTSPSHVLRAPNYLFRPHSDI